jgi:putative transposase
MNVRRNSIESGHPNLSIRRQCDLLGVNRSSHYRNPIPETPLNLLLMRLLDEKYMEAPFYGRPKYTEWLKRNGYHVNHKRVGRLLSVMGIRGMVPGPKTTKRNRSHQTYPYLLKNLDINRPNHVWAADITWIPTSTGYLYLVAIIDWYSRYVLSWSLSNSMHTDFCLEALEEALRMGRPEIFNTDQGVQFTDQEFTGVLKANEIGISMDSKGRYQDNIIIERLWRSVKYEEVYLKNYETGQEAYDNLEWYLNFYNTERTHMSLGHKTPSEVYFAA